MQAEEIHKPASEASKNFVRTILPWFLGLGMFLIYAITLNRWVSPDSLYQICNLSGKSWFSELTKPVSFLVTLPLRWFPASFIPLAANGFAAICGALSLGLLARCVALLPHDRTKEERHRNSNKLAFLTIKTAWLPPVVAVFACGLQLTFWEQSVSATGEMFDLLLFAYMVRALLEYRVSEKSSWLLKFVFVNGIAMANNWAMVAFFPVFLFALLWIVGFFRFFKPSYVAKFLKRQERLNLRLPLVTIGVWLLGTLLFLLMPLVVSFRHISHVDFWPGLRFEAHVYRLFLASFSMPILIGLALMALLPVSFMGIRWGRLLSEVHPFAAWMATIMFHVVHGFFLLVTLWIMLDSPFSPRNIQPFYSCLPLYFLMGLSVGYYSGYFLIVFRQPVDKSRRQLQHSLMPLIHAIAVAAISLLALLTPAEFLYKNLPGILRARAGNLAGYLDVLEKATPAPGAVILSEDPIRLEYLESAVMRSHRDNDYLLVDTGLLARQPTYFEFLNKSHPDFKLQSLLPGNRLAITNTADLVQFLNTLSQHHELYFMHPFAGYLGEIFYQQPRKLFYQLKPYPQNSAFPPAFSREIVAENEAFWASLNGKAFPELLHRVQASKAVPPRNFLQTILDRSHIHPTLDGNAILAGGYYSMMLNGWGVELQRAGKLPEAAKAFQTAQQLNPENSAAEINLTCNTALQNHQTLSVDPSLGIEERFNQRREWDQSLRQNGPADEPNICFRFGAVLEGIQMYRQSLQQWQRAQLLAPADFDIPLRMAESFLNLMQPTNALLEANWVLSIQPQNSRAWFLKGFAEARLEKYSQAIGTLGEYQKFEPNSAEARLLRGYSYMKLGSKANARAEYDQAAKLAANPYGAYYGLAELGYRTKDAALAITNCELYLTVAPAGAPEALQIKTWLAELKSSSTNAPTPSAKK